MHRQEQRMSVYESSAALYTDPTAHLGFNPPRGSFSTQAAVNYSERSVVTKILISLGRAAYLSLC